jgi:DnaJ-class molecular chaperone
MCQTCKGHKEVECNWCHGTGYLVVGDQVFYSTAEHDNHCPVCKGQGACKCEQCRGTGFRAFWLPDSGQLLP